MLMNRVFKFLLSILVFSVVLLLQYGMQTATAASLNYDVSGGQLTFDDATDNISTMTVVTSTATPIQGQSFNLTIIGAKGINGIFLTGVANVTVSSNNVSEDLTSITSVTMDSCGNGTIPVTLRQTGAQTLTVSLTGVSASKTPSVTVQLATVAVTGVTLNRTSETITAGSIDQLTATVAPANATNQNVSWISDNTVVWISPDGYIFGLAAGTANITVTTQDGSYTSTCAVTVQNGIENPDYYFNVINGEAQITRCKGAGGVVTIPSTLGGFPVTSISHEFGPDALGAFEGYTNITSISVPQGVKSIDHDAFYGCTGLTTITIAADNLNYSSINGILFNKSGTSLIVCPEGLTSISIPQGVTSIGDSAFYNCSGLTSISIPQGVTSIGSGAFSNCTGLTSISIPQGVKSIGEYTFNNCIALTSISIPQGVTSIGDSAFSGCRGLTSISIPQGVTSIGMDAFSDCTGLTSISLSQGITSIGGYAFSNCTGLTSISIPQEVTSLSGGVFSGCKNLTSINIPRGVTSIGGFAFSYCTGLTSIGIPQGVTSIGDGAFSGCTGLTHIIVDADNSNYASIDGVLFNKAGTSLIACPGGLTTISISQGVTNIGNRAFINCTGLTSISIPQSLISIDYAAFYNCTGLSSIRFNSTTTSIYDLAGTIPAATKIIGYASSTAETYAANYNRTFEVIGTITGVSLNNNVTTINAGANEILSATITPDDATDKSVKWSVYSQSGINIVAVSVTGLVTAINPGTAVIRATSNGDPTMYAECNVTVTAGVSIELSATPIV